MRYCHSRCSPPPPPPPPQANDAARDRWLSNERVHLDARLQGMRAKRRELTCHLAKNLNAQMPHSRRSCRRCRSCCSLATPFSSSRARQGSPSYNREHSYAIAALSLNGIGKITQSHVQMCQRQSMRCRGSYSYRQHYTQSANVCCHTLIITVVAASDLLASVRNTQQRRSRDTL